MAQHYRLDSVLLPQGWTRDALVTVAQDGRISAIETGGGAGGTGGPQQVERIAGFVVPGMPNAHSHAFQRGMTGHTEFRLSARDSFWTWRQAMYGLANRIEPEDLQVLATQLFIEMLKAGYTSVAEFHYLHRRPAGGHYPDGAGLWDAIIAAAAASGIGLTLLPTLYLTSDFGGAPLKPEQTRFASDTDWFLRGIEARVGAERSAGPAALRTGAAFHSLRAVPLETLREAALALRRIDPSLPLHIHVAEQVQEVDSCKSHTGRRPIELLLETGLLDEHWCLVHATHATAAELQGIAAAKATVCLSITTEANLGDGFFEAARFLKMGGRLCVGSDSQATVCPAEELRWMEYQQRLRKRRRAVLTDKRDSHVGTRLWRDASLHGAQAIGQPAGAIEMGRRADWLVLDGAHPSMAGSVPDNALDHLVFAGGSAAIRDVMVAGRWVVKDRRHAAEPMLQPRFADLMKRLAT
ncbi:MAG: formimidoylglutamate deiminase [Gammaproteobacteria bacterium]|jgi:formimidoylglutamate deiminase|nr:formimidoylglutamate deiminase [Gammaproteobacteria bacterium]